MADREVWSVGKSWHARVKSRYLWVTTYHEDGGASSRAVARFLTDEDAELTLAMLRTVLPEAKEDTDG